MNQPLIYQFTLPIVIACRDAGVSDNNLVCRVAGGEHSVYWLWAVIAVFRLGPANGRKKRREDRARDHVFSPGI